MILSLRRVAPGTDGAVTPLGTSAGLVGAISVTLAGAWALQLDACAAAAALLGGVTGLFFDSVLGATIERRGWINNDLVNAISTGFAAAVAALTLAIVNLAR